ADAVPQLKPGEADAPKLLAPPAVAVSQLIAVVVADHVVREDDVALTSKVDGAARHRASVSVLQATVSPVTMRAENRRERAALAPRPVQIASDEKACVTFKIDFFDSVILMLDAIKDSRVEGALRRPRQQTCARKYLPPQVFGAR